MLMALAVGLLVILGARWLADNWPWDYSNTDDDWSDNG